MKLNMGGTLCCFMIRRCFCCDEPMTVSVCCPLPARPLCVACRSMKSNKGRVKDAAAHAELLADGA